MNFRGSNLEPYFYFSLDVINCSRINHEKDFNRKISFFRLLKSQPSTTTDPSCLVRCKYKKQENITVNSSNWRFKKGKYSIAVFLVIIYTLIKKVNVASEMQFFFWHFIASRYKTCGPFKVTKQIYCAHPVNSKLIHFTECFSKRSFIFTATIVKLKRSFCCFCEHSVWILDYDLEISFTWYLIRGGS